MKTGTTKLNELEKSVSFYFQDKFEIPAASFRLIRRHNKEGKTKEQIMKLALERYNFYQGQNKNTKYIGTKGTWKGIINFFLRYGWEEWLEVTKNLTELYYGVDLKSVTKRFPLPIPNEGER